MKKKFLSLAYLSVMVFTGCMKQSPLRSRIGSGEPYLHSVPQIQSVLYVNNFRDILGNSKKEDSLLNWCRAHGFTSVNLYNTGTILGAKITAQAQLNDFVGKAHKASYGIKVNFVAVSSEGVNDIGGYCARYVNKPDGIVTEYEFWKTPAGSPPNSFAMFTKILAAMTTLHNNYPSVSRNAYVSTFKDATSVARTSSSIIQYLIKNCETMFLVNYYEKAYELSPAFKTKLQQVSNEAKRLHKVGNIVILFNVNPNSADPNIYRYFSKPPQGSNHNFIDAYNNLFDDYKMSVDINNDGLSIKGYGIFRYSDARGAKP